MKTQVELLKECCDIKDAACVRYQKRIAKLEEENKKLRAYADNLDSENDNQAIEIEELKEENKKLRERIEALELCIDVD